MQFAATFVNISMFNRLNQSWTLDYSVHQNTVLAQYLIKDLNVDFIIARICETANFPTLGKVLV
jgi:hypothetical protein